MTKLAILLAIGLPSFLFAYIAFKLQDRHSVIRMLLVGVAVTFTVGLPLTGWRLALANNYKTIADYMLGFELGTIAIVILFDFYLFWLYIKDTSKIMSGTNNGVDDLENV